MTNKDLERIENRLLAIVEQNAPEDACNAAKTLVDVFCQLEEIKIRKEQHAQYVQQFEETRGKVKSAEVTPCNVRDEVEDLKGPVEESTVESDSAIQRMLDKDYEGEHVVLFQKHDPCFKYIQEAIEPALMTCPEGCTFTYKLMEAGTVDDHFIILLCGGNNGHSAWSAYLQWINEIVVRLGAWGSHPWIIKIDNDCLDDVHYIYIGMKYLPTVPEESPDPELELDLEGYVRDDGSDRWGTRKFRVCIDGMDSDSWRQIKNYVYGYGDNSYSVGDSDLHTEYFWVTRSCWGVKECPKGEYKRFEEDVHQLMKDLKALFPNIVGRRGVTLVKR